MIGRAATTLMLAGAVLATAATGMGYRAPSDEPTRLSAGADADLAASTCACHSLDYITTQPRGKGDQFWKDSVAKMVNVYGAPIEPADAERISAYLGATYGRPPKNDRRRSASAK